MQACTRRAVAYVAGSLISGRTAVTIYDYQDKRHVSMSGAAKAGSVAVYDHEQRCHIVGAGGTLYHYGNRAHITLQLNGPNFSGYDYDSKAHFSGTVNQQSISVYDYAAKVLYNYSL